MKANKSNPKIFTGGTKQRSKVKIGLLVAVGVLLLSAVCYAGFTKYKEHDLKAKAANYATVYDGYGITIKTCKYSSTWGYGVRAVATKPTDGNPRDLILLTYKDAGRSQRLDTKYSHNWWGDSVTAVQAYALPDGWYQVQVDQKNSGPVAMGFTPWC